jgi:hypothetical protein
LKQKALSFDLKASTSGLKDYASEQKALRSSEKALAPCDDSFPVVKSGIAGEVKGDSRRFIVS